MRSRLLVVEGDPTSLRVMDVSLRSAGFDVVTAASGSEALALLDHDMPDLVLSDTVLGGIDGFELCLRVRKNPRGASTPFIFLAADKTLEHKIRSLAAGANDYLVKPAYIKEVVARVRALLQRRDRERLASDQHPTDGHDRFAGSLADITVVDLLQLIEGNGRSAMAHLRGPSGAPAAIYFRHGKVIDAEVGRLSGLDALSRLFSWTTGSFEIEWRSIRRKDAIERPSNELVAEGMQRLDEWNRLLGSLSDSQAAFEVDYQLLGERLAEIPDEVNGILRLCDGIRTILQVVEDCAVPDVEALTMLIRLRDEGIVYSVSAVRPSGREDGSARFPDSPSVPSSAFSSGAWSGPMGRAGTARTGIGSEPAEQLFAERLQVQAHDEVPSVSSESQIPDREASPQRQPTAPAFEQSVTTTAPDAVPSMAAFAGQGLDGIPEPRAEQDNLIKFPSPDDSPLQSGPTALAEADATPASPSTGPDADNLPAARAPWNMRPTLPLGRANELRALHAESPAVEPVQTVQSIPERMDVAPTGPSLLTDTYRGFGPKPGQVVSRRGEVQTETQQPSRPPTPDSAPVIASGTLISPAEPSQPSPGTNVDSPAPIEVGPGEGTVRVTFPDDDITRGDALDELGLPSRWRVARILAIAALAGALAAVGVYSLRNGLHGEATPNRTALAPVIAPDHGSGVAASRTQQIPPPSPNPPSPIGPDVPAPRAPAVELPNPVEATVRSGLGKPTDHARSAETSPNEPSQPMAHQVPSGISARPPGIVAEVPDRALPPPGELVTSGRTAAASKPKADFSRQLSDCQAAFSRNKLREALSACSAAVDAHPDSAPALAMLAHIELNRGRLPRASELATKAVTLDPNLADAYVIIGGALQDSGQNREAKAAYRHYLQLAPRGRYADELRSIVNTL